MSVASIQLGVNVDHVATLRQARGTRYPDPVAAALLAEQAGADSITIHLREDRRHIQERDLEILLRMVQTRVNLEMAMTEPMLDIALANAPADCCFVPERRAELTTEGGLDVAAQTPKVAAGAFDRLSGRETAPVAASPASPATLFRAPFGGFARRRGAPRPSSTAA